MKKIILVALFVFLNFHLFAQTNKDNIQGKFNLSGTWVLEKIESPKYLDIKDYQDYLLVASLINDELKIKKSYIHSGESVNFEITLFIDNRGEKNIVPWSINKNVEETSRTQIKKNKVVREYALKTEINGKEQNFRGYEKYYLSKDDNKLIFESVQTFPSFAAILGPDNERKFIFRRKS